MRVKHLLDLLSVEGYNLTRDVKHFRDNKKCPVAVRMVGEGDYTRCLHSGDEEWRYGRYTPRAYFALLAWQETYERMTQGDAEYYAVEWVNVSEAFRTVRYLRKPIHVLIHEFMEELKHVVDSGHISVHFGRYDLPPPPDKPNCKVRDYVMEDTMLKSTTNYHQPEVWDAVVPGAPKAYSWDEIKDCYVSLSEIEEAFILGEDMRRCTDLDAKFLKACIECNVDEMNRLLDDGANMYATEEFGDSAAQIVVQSFGSYEGEKSLDTVLKAIDCLLSRDYDLNFSGYDAPTALYQAGYTGDSSLIESLLVRGADPNEPSWLGSDWHETASVVMDMIDTDKFLNGDPDGEYERVQYALLRYGALPCADVEIEERPNLEEIYRYDDSDIVGCREDAGLQEQDKCLIGAARHLCTYWVQRTLKFGAKRDVVDSKGRGVLRIALEDAMEVLSTRKERRWAPEEYDYAEFVISWISGFGNSYSVADEKYVNEFCTRKGFERMRSEIRKCLEIKSAKERDGSIER